jgi:c-di-GMP-related signal transduction protein
MGRVIYKHYVALSLNFLQFSRVISNIIKAIVSVQRLLSFLNARELQMYRTVIETPMLQHSDEVGIFFLIGSM